jgi:TonB-linked SusC/RagA family outer membrane protein
MKLKLKGILALFLLLIAQLTIAQDKTISGTVTDGAGVPVPGVNVLVKGSKSGTQTDVDGKFKVNATAGQTLVFSFTGMKTMEVSASNGMKVKMADSSQVLGEVVVTALGVKKSEKAIGYAAQAIKGNSLTEARESNLVNALSGKIAGVQVTNSSGAVGASSRLVLRGASSITGNNEALFVVDGVPFDNSSSNDRGYDNLRTSAAGSGGGRDLPNGIASINPDDIESITVLKGPNAAALYGLRASNGVVIITTKSGKKGLSKGNVSYNSNITFSKPLVLPNYQNSYGQGSTSDYFEFVGGDSSGYNDGVDESWGAPLDRGLSFVQWDSFKVGGAPLPWISHPNNVKDFYDTGVSLSNSISISGGGEDANMRLSIGNNDEKGMIPFTDFKKFNVGLNGNMKLSEKLTAGISLNYFNDKSNNLPTVGYNNENVVQQFIWSARNVNFKDLRDWRNLPLASASSPAAGTPVNWNTNYQNNPYWTLETNRNTYDRDRITGSTNLGYKFTSNFSTTGKISIDHFSQLTTGRQAFGSNSAANGSYGENSLRYSEINAESILSYKNKITNDISFGLNFGGNTLKRIRTQKWGFASALELPEVYNLSNLKSGATAISGNNYNELRINSIFGFGQVSYKDYLFIDFSGRNDWASVFAKENDSFFYPAVSGSLVLSELLNTKTSKVNYIKLRGGWSKVGGIGALGAYNINTSYGLAVNGFGTQGNLPGTQFNPNIKPESVTGTEIGIDVNAFNNRIRFSGTYYTKISTDLIVNVPVSAASGYLQSWENIARMENKGIELQLGFTPVKSKDFSFDIDLNFAKNDNKVDDLGGVIKTINLGGQWGVTLEAIEGESYGSLVGRGFQKDTNGNVIFVNGIAQIETDKKILGNITPDWTGGANFSFKYKQFDFNTLIDAKIGGDLHSMSYSWGRYAGTLEETLIGRETGVVGNGVMSDGNGGYVTNNVVVPAKTFNQTAYGNTIEESAIFDASYIKLRQMSLGYSLPKKWLNNSPIDEIKFSVVARNLAILYRNTPHIDPETGFSSANGEQGQEFGQLPSARSYGFNLNVKF